MDKPDVDFIEGLSPAISIDQKSASRNPRSTVGTITEVYDYLRLLFARIGVPHCPNDGTRHHPPDPAADRRPRARAARGHPLPGAGAGGARPQGRVRHAAHGPRRPGLRPRPRRRRGRTSSTDSASSSPATSSTPSRSSSTAWCAARASSAASPTRSRPRCSSPRAWPRSRSWAATTTTGRRRRDPHVQPAPRPARRAALSFEELAPRNFSFNSPYGACEHCDGLGTRFEVDPELVVPDADLSHRRGRHRRRGRSARTPVLHRLLEAVCAETTASTSTRRGRSSRKKQQKIVLYGTGATARCRCSTRTATAAHARTTTPVRGRHPVAASAATPSAESDSMPRADRGLHARGAVPDVRRRPAEARSARGHRRTARTSHEVCDMSIGEAAEVPRRARARPSATA